MEGMRFISLAHALGKKLLRNSCTAVLDVWEGTMASDCKNIRLIKKIGTHSGVFHCDEALACYMLKQLPEYCDASIIRSRDADVLATCDIVVDVGGSYKPKTHRYDHHQREFTETLNSVRPDLTNGKFKMILLSSAGLIYAHFGLEVITEILKKHNIAVNSNGLSSLYTFVYEGFVEEIDGIDNGIPMYSEGKQKYKISTHLSARVHKLNPEWNSVLTESTDELFQKAMKMVGEEFSEKILCGAKVWWPAREIVKKAIEDRKKIHESGEIILLTERCPWKEHLMALEEEMGISGQLKFCIFGENNDSWRVQGIPIQPDSFICRVFLHKDWCGVRDEELSKVSGINDCIFCHATGFIGGNKTKEGALQMALQSIEANGK